MIPFKIITNIDYIKIIVDSVQDFLKKVFNSNELLRFKKEKKNESQ